MNQSNKTEHLPVCNIATTKTYMCIQCTREHFLNQIINRFLCVHYTRLLCVGRTVNVPTKQVTTILCRYPVYKTGLSVSSLALYWRAVAVWTALQCSTKGQPQRRRPKRRRRRKVRRSRRVLLLPQARRRAAIALRGHNDALLLFVH